MRIASRAVPIVCTLLALGACKKDRSDGATVTTSDTAVQMLEFEPHPGMQAPRPAHVLPLPVDGYGHPQGGGHNREGYAAITENEFQDAAATPLSTFAIDVDAASYANVRRFLLADGRMPPPDAVRIEELV